MFEPYENALIEKGLHVAEEGRDWSAEAKGLLKAELKRRGMTYADMVNALSVIGVIETEANLRNKISRGNFSAAFLLQSLNAIGCTVVHLGEPLVGKARISASVRAKLAENKRRYESGRGSGDK